MADLGRAILLVVVTLGLLIWLSDAGDKPEVLVDASPACAAPRLNPCARVDCNRPDTRRIA